MSISHSLRRLSAAAAACSLLLVAAPAPAGIIASFDPAFGAAIPNLGFKGTITLDVTAGCYALGPGFFNTGGPCQITAQSAQINFYNLLTPNNTLTSVTLNATYFAASYVFGAYFDPVTGQLAGFDTNDSNVFNVSVTDSNPLAPINYNGSMVLFFKSGFAQVPDVLTLSAVPSATVPGVGGAYLRNCTDSTRTNPCISNGANTSNPGRLTFTPVPEPDGVALALLGLGALAVTRRRARNPR